MRVLVTGGAVFIGGHVVDALLAAGHEVRVLDALLPAVHAGSWPGHLGPRAERLRGDVRTATDVDAALRGVDAVCHQAAMVGLGVYLQDLPAYVGHNDLGTAVLLAPPATNREEAVERAVATYRVIGSTGYPLDEDWLREVAGASYDRGYDPLGVARQLMAIHASGDRTPGLRQLRVPTLVVHGEDDPLVQVAGGRATAEAVPDSTLLVLPGMGHNLPRELWPTILDALAEHAAKAQLAR